MTVLIAVETLVLMLLTLLVAGLLRSHAEIMRRLEGYADVDMGTGGELESSLPKPTERQLGRAFDLIGTTLADDAVKVGMSRGAPNTLLAFLSSGCLTCKGFWEALGRESGGLPGNARVIAVTKDSNQESPSKLRKLAPPNVETVMSSDAWHRYDVPGAPYFVYVDAESGTVTGEGAAVQWSQVVSLLEDALADSELAAAGKKRGWRLRRRSAQRRRVETPAERDSRADRELTAAGIGPGDPSLWPGGVPDEVREKLEQQAKGRT